MLRKAVGATLAALLFTGSCAAPALSQTTGNPASQPAVPAASKAAAKARPVKPKAVAQPTAAGAPAGTADLEYPPCSKTVKDHCIQLWQRSLGKAYPQCVTLKNGEAKAACIEAAFKRAKP